MHVCVHVCVYVRSYFNLYNSVYTDFLPLSLSISLSLYLSLSLALSLSRSLALSLSRSLSLSLSYTHRVSSNNSLQVKTAKPKKAAAPAFAGARAAMPAAVPQVDKAWWLRETLSTQTLYLPALWGNKEGPQIHI